MRAYMHVCMHACMHICVTECMKTAVGFLTHMQQVNSTSTSNVAARGHKNVSDEESQEIGSGPPREGTNSSPGKLRAAPLTSAKDARFVDKVMVTPMGTATTICM
jgi:hypothetical protein